MTDIYTNKNMKKNLNSSQRMLGNEYICICFSEQYNILYI